MLWRRADGKCEKCGNELTNPWHAHHRYPWVLTRRTTINEMMAVCSRCNLEMGDRMDFFDESGLRLGQRLAMRTILRRIGEGTSHSAIVMATRYGKSDLQRITTMVGCELRLVCCGLSLSPTDFLCDQMVDAAKWAAMVNRTKLQGTPKYNRITTCVMNPTANGEQFLSVGMQLFQINLNYWKEWGRDIRRRTGLPVVLFVDECHTNSTTNKWGSAVTEWQKYADGHVVLCTATAERADGERIPGFEYKLEDEEDIIVYKNRPGSKPEKIRIDKFGGIKAVLKLVPHETITFGQAWREGVLCHVEHIPFDVDLDVVDQGSTAKGMLSAITVDRDITRALSRSIRHPIVMRGGCELAVRRLQSFRAIDPKSALIIFCGNDNDPNDNEYNQHARQVGQIINGIDASLKIVIATSKNEGKVELDAFANGAGDVLIVKQMAALGIDISRLKVGLDLSPVRTKAAVIQRMMRVATPHRIPNRQQELLVCAWITPADNLSTAIYQSVVVANGGQATAMDLQLMESYEKDRGQSPPRPEYVPTGTHGAGARDTQGNTATESDLDQYARSIMDLVPEVGAFLTQPELVQRQKTRNGQSAAAAQPQNTGAQVQQLREEIVALHKQVINSRMKQPYSQPRYGELGEEIWRSAMNSCGIPLKYKLKQINDLTQINALRDKFLQMLQT